MNKRSRWRCVSTHRSDKCMQGSELPESGGSFEQSLQHRFCQMDGLEYHKKTVRRDTCPIDEGDAHRAWVRAGWKLALESVKTPRELIVLVRT